MEYEAKTYSLSDTAIILSKAIYKLQTDYKELKPRIEELEHENAALEERVLKNEEIQERLVQISCGMFVVVLCLVHQTFF